MGVLDREEVSHLGLTGAALAVVEALIAAPLAWRSPFHLRHDSQLEEAAIFCGLAELETAGLVCHWETDDELTITLTPIGAARFKVRLIETGPDELPRWASPETPEPPAPKAKGIFREYQALSVVVGPTLPPDEIAEDAEEAALGHHPDAHPAGSGHRPIRPPGRFIGADLPWSGYAAAGDRPPVCPSCNSQVIPGIYCLHCDGVDAEPVRSKRTRSRAAKRFAQARADRGARRRASSMKGI